MPGFQSLLKGSLIQTFTLDSRKLRMSPKSRKKFVYPNYIKIQKRDSLGSVENRRKLIIEDLHKLPYLSDTAKAIKIVWPSVYISITLMEYV